MVYLFAIAPIDNPVISGLKGKTQADAPALLGKFLSGVVGGFLVVATLWAFIQLLQAGLAWISSGGDKTSLENARGRITNAMFGLFIVFAFWAIYIVVLQFLGISSGGFNITVPKLL